MRMRKKKNGEKRLESCSELLYERGEEILSDPGAVMGMKGAPVFLEIGAGKGGFACEMARRNPSAAYFAMERVSDCAMLCAERAMSMREEGRDNLRIIVDTADNLTRIFGEGTVSHIFLNFSDPWSKKGYAKRRLTHRRYLAVYLNLLCDGGKLTFKTDNVGLFDFSLEEVEAMGISLDKMTRDLHNSEYNEGNVVTEYEANFSSMGVSINMLEFTKPVGYTAEIPDNLKRDRKDYRNG